MCKYITTSKHPELKEGLTVRVGDDMELWFNDSILHTDQSIPILLAKGYIKEVEEKEFTRSDMIDFLWNNSNKHKDRSKALLDDWQKQRSND